MKAVIIDDEPDCVKLLAIQLRMSCPHVEVVAECTNSENGLHAIREHRPALVFLDIEMPRMNGFQLLEAIGEIDFGVVFVTAYDRFALKAFRFSALDYLLKPVDSRDLQKAVQRAEKMNRVDRGQIDILKHHLKPGEFPTNGKMALPYQNGVTFVDISTILYCEADNNYTRFYLAKGEEHVVTKTLRDVQEVMEERNFLRVHRQYLINLDHIKKFVRGEGNYLVMSDNKTIPVSKGHKDELMQRFGWL
ncbi:MAG TPA: LytTR family DNA-binding domain-containing protein [Cyclobacteriaceae bacterium]|nr:LytTR family DNA-binding domain-containing protein [Cyclobacteriaceae bacterium]